MRNKLKCYYCQNKQVPNYKEFETLEKFLTDRAKIMPRSRSGVCAKHQRLLARAVKRARHLGLLAFVV